MLRFTVCTKQRAAVKVWVVMIVALSFCSHLLLRATSPASPNGLYRLPLRTEVQATKGSGLWQKAHFKQDFSIGETTILICDMRDQRWCAGPTQRVDQLAQKWSLSSKLPERPGF